MNYSNNNDPLHGVTLKTILTLLQEKYGWQGLADRIRINCFSHDPSIQSSLKFLRKTPWARKKVENLYVRTKWPKSDDQAQASSKPKRDSEQNSSTNITKEPSPWANAQANRDKT